MQRVIVLNPVGHSVSAGGGGDGDGGGIKI
jgi:hypothetical protein